MQVLLDTHLLLWAAYEPGRLSPHLTAVIDNPAHEVYFSAASIWEVAIKASLGREDFAVNPQVLRRGLLANGYRELSVTAEHAAAVYDLPALHRDPFDRILVAQSRTEGIPLLTVDPALQRYGVAAIAD